MSANYDFSINEDFPNHTVATDRLSKEIIDSNIVTALDRVDTVGDLCSTVFKATLNNEDVTILHAIVAAHTGEALPQGTQQVTLSGVDVISSKLVTSTYPTKGLRYTVYTHNWANKTTWYQESTRVVDETPTDTGDHLTYTLAHQYVIDTYHGKIFGEDFLTDADENSYRVVIKVNNVTKTEQDPHIVSGGDYTIDYVNGTVTFLQSQENNTVTVTYYYAQSSKFIVSVSEGKTYDLVRVECQFASDTQLKDTVIYKVTALVGPGGSRVTVTNPLVYKTMYNFIDDRDEVLEVQKAFDVNNWRGLSKDVYSIRWNYVAVTEFSSEYGTQIEMSLEHDEAFEGTYVTTTLEFLVNESLC
jgi:hypothetical protein